MISYEIEDAIRDATTLDEMRDALLRLVRLAQYLEAKEDGE